MMSKGKILVVDDNSGIRAALKILLPKYFNAVELLASPVWGIERSGFFNGREKWAKGFENQRV